MVKPRSTSYYEVDDRSSSSGDDDQYKRVLGTKDRLVAASQSKLPTFLPSRRSDLRPPTPVPDVKPNGCRLVQKEMLQLLSGLFSWDLFLAGKKQPKCDFAPEFLAEAAVRKRETSWKQSVVRLAAQSIEEATQNKDEKKIYSTLLQRRNVMDKARAKAHGSRLAPLPQRSAGAIIPGPLSSAVSASSSQGILTGVSPSLLSSRAATSMSCGATANNSASTTSLLLLNDDMLEQEIRNEHCRRVVSPSLGDERDVAVHVAASHRTRMPFRCPPLATSH